MEVNKELLIQSQDGQISIALLEDGRLLELHKEGIDNDLSVGDFFVGKVKKIAPALNAAFVHIGGGKDAFLHYQDLGPRFLSVQKFLEKTKTGHYPKVNLKAFTHEYTIDKNGKIADILSTGQDILVQVVKEPISTKGPRITSELSIAGRYLILVPFSDKISLSQKIKDRKERQRLRRLVESITPEGFGVIIRTVAMEKKVSDLHADLKQLLNKWEVCSKNLRNKSSPAKLLSEMDRASSILRDVLDDQFNRILCDDVQLVSDLKNYISHIAPKKIKIVDFYKGPMPLFEKYGVERQIKLAFGKVVSIAKGSYLVIEHTEALHVIDINSGNSSSKKSTSEENHAMEVNLRSASEVARQLRLRDMGGIIVVDFIDLNTIEQQKKLYEHLKEQMKSDRAKHKILPPTKFGLVQITRQRVRSEMSIETKEIDPDSIKTIDPPIGVINQIDIHLSKLIEPVKSLSLHTHPFISAYLTKGLFSIQMKWFFKYRKWVKIYPRDSYTYLEYHFFDKKGNELIG